MTEIQTSDQDLRQLAEAFDTFNLVSSQLEASYSSLEARIADLRRQVQAAHKARRRESQSKTLIAERLASLLEALPGGVIVLDKNGDVSEFNSCALLWIPGISAGVCWKTLSKKVFKSQLTSRGELILQDGRSLIVTKQQRVEDNCTILLLTDTTEQRRVDDIVVRHQRLASLGEMIATLVHQIRTPVTSALLYASSAVSEDITSIERSSLIRKNIACLTDLESLITDMLTFSNGHSANSDATVFLHQLVNDVERSVRPLRGEQQTLNVVTPPIECRIKGNSHALSSALQNLVVNALQAAPANGVVSLSASVEQQKRRDRPNQKTTKRPKAHFAEQSLSLAAGDVLRIAVADNGSGIAPDEYERVFEPFFTKKPNGTGLGLSAARSIIRAHQGDISVSNNPRGGATFVVSLPIHDLRGTTA